MIFYFLLILIAGASTVDGDFKAGGFRPGAGGADSCDSVGAGSRADGAGVDATQP